MATIEPESEPNINKKPNREIEEYKLRRNALFRGTLRILTQVTTITVIFALVLIVDNFIFYLINWLVGVDTSQNLFLKNIFEGIQLFIGVATAITYVIYLAYSLFQELKREFKMIRETGKEKESLS